MSLPVLPPVARSLPWLALSLALPTVARAAPAGADEPFLNPRQALDPRVEIDPRLDLPDPPRPARDTSGSHQRAPVWFSVGGSAWQIPAKEPGFGAMFLMGLPLDRLAAHQVHAAIAEETRAPPGEAREAREGPPGRRKLDLSPPPPPPKIEVPVPTDLPPPLRVPAVVTPEAARAAVDAALRHAHLVSPQAHLDALASRARQSAGLPELRLRVMRTLDDGQTLSPVSYDPNRIVAVDSVGFWLEARATWRLDRLLFAEEEVKIERMRHLQVEAQTRVQNHVLKLLFEWQRARAQAENEDLPPEENLSARLRVLETEAEIDVLTDGWFSRWRGPRASPGP